jgi:uncharacterized protein with von Willebrand factor type A (vWA) domain
VFLDLFFGLRAAGVPVGMQEWLTLVEALEKGLHGSALLRFYHLARACLVKSEAYYDAFDRVFARVFQGVEGSLDIEKEVLDWLKDPRNFTPLTPEQLAELERLSHDELMRRFMETLAEQDERHDGGNRWVGTGGRSPYGHGGQHPTGIRVGGPARNRSAMKVAEERHFSDYRTDVNLDVRHMRVALKKLRRLTRVGPATELDIDETVDETCRNAGEIEFVFRPPRRNNLRLLLMMDVGGTMDPYYEPVSSLLTALVGERSLREMQAVYFHNCVYDVVYRTAAMRKTDEMPTADLLRRLDERWKLLIVGDAAMHPAELLEAYGNIDPRRVSPTPGIDWLRRLADHFERSAWLNPDEPRIWDHSHTVRIVRKLFPMYRLSIEGVAEAVNALVGARVAKPETVS